MKFSVLTPDERGRVTLPNNFIRANNLEGLSVELHTTNSPNELRLVFTDPITVNNKKQQSREVGK